MYRDYKNYDYLSVSVKSDQLNRILSCYSALGWRVVKREDDRQYYNMRYLVLRRPHKIKNKDRLQYLQVRMENTLNQMSVVASKRHVKSTVLCSLSCILSLALAVAGLWLLFGMGQELGYILGIISFSLAGAAFVSAMISSLVLRRRENGTAKVKIEQKLLLLQQLTEEAKLLAAECNARKEKRSEPFALEGGGE